MGWSCATEAWIRVNLINLRWGPYAASEWRGKALRPAWTFLKALHKGRVSNTLWDQRDQTVVAYAGEQRRWHHIGREPVQGE